MLSLWLFILLIFFAPQQSYSQQDGMYYYECAKPFDCGSLKNLSYPFWTGLSQACGSDGFHLQCRDRDVPVITIENQDFLVLALDQSRNEMAIARVDVLRDDSCPDDITKFTNITLNTAHFSLVPDFYTKFSNITLFYNCTNLTNPDSSCPINGEERDMFISYDGLRGGELMEEVRSKCNIKVEIPVPKTALQDFYYLSDVAGQGFNVSYKYNEDCISCRESGGRCGSYLTNPSFTCFCSDQPYPISCPSKAGMYDLSIILP
ncbi:hypothetical protein M5689_004024 [Euphorbia peplus]|nr:hypothetical protein M5689_004024 [Euphorbia peplus]